MRKLVEFCDGSRCLARTNGSGLDPKSSGEEFYSSRRVPSFHAIAVRPVENACAAALDRDERRQLTGRRLDDYLDSVIDESEEPEELVDPYYRYRRNPD